MKKAVRLSVSILVGIVSFVAVGVGVTEILAERIWLSAIVGIPAGSVAGVFMGVVSYGLFKYRDTHSTETLVNTGSFIAATLGFVAGGSVGVAVSGFPLISGMVVIGFPVGLVTGTVVGYITHRYLSHNFI